MIIGSIAINSVIFVLTDLDVLGSKIGNAFIYGSSSFTIVGVVVLLSWSFSREYDIFTRNFIASSRRLGRVVSAHTHNLNEPDNDSHSDQFPHADGCDDQGDRTIEDRGNGGIGTSSSFPISDSNWRRWRAVYCGTSSVTWSSNPVYGVLEDLRNSTSQDSGFSSGISTLGSTNHIYANLGSIENLSPSRCPSFSPPPVPKVSRVSSNILTSPYAVTPLCSISPSIHLVQSDYDRPRSYLVHC